MFVCVREYTYVCVHVCVGRVQCIEYGFLELSRQWISDTTCVCLCVVATEWEHPDSVPC